MFERHTMNEAYHYPPDVLDLLVETIPRLTKSKRNVLMFYEGAGVPRSLITDRAEAIGDRENSIPKAAIVRTVLQRLQRSSGTVAELTQADLPLRRCDWKQNQTCLGLPE